MQCWKCDFPSLVQALVSWISPSLRSHSSEKRRRKKHSDQCKACVCVIEQNQTALADKHTDIHKNQYSSTLFTVKLAKNKRLLCVCMHHIALWDHQSEHCVDSTDSGYDGFWWVHMGTRLCMMKLWIWEQHSRIGLGDMRRRRRRSYFQHVSHARYKDRNRGRGRTCLTSVCVTCLSLPTLAESNGCFWKIKTWFRTRVSSTLALDLQKKTRHCLNPNQLQSGSSTTKF